jgi:hypothetical protein
MSALILGACGSTQASVAPSSPPPTPVITPNPHLTDPATADQIFRAIGSAGLALTASNASTGGPNSPMVKRINAAFAGWPLIITQFQTGPVLRTAVKWDPGKPPPPGSAPYNFVGLNILIEFGPGSGLPAAPDTARQEQAQRLLAAIDPLLSPVEQRSVLPLQTAEAATGSAAP